MPKKLPSRAPGRKSNPTRVSRGSLASPSGSGMPMAGKGSRGTGATKLRPSTADATWSRDSLLNVPSNPTRGMRGNQGTKTGS
jgi:hypothetical protein